MHKFSIVLNYYIQNDWINRINCRPRKKNCMLKLKNNPPDFSWNTYRRRQIIRNIWCTERVRNLIYRMIDYFWKIRLLVFMITFVKRLSTTFTFCWHCEESRSTTNNRSDRITLMSVTEGAVRCVVGCGTVKQTSQPDRFEWTLCHMRSYRPLTQCWRREL